MLELLGEGRGCALALSRNVVLELELPSREQWEGGRQEKRGDPFGGFTRTEMG